MCGICGKLNFDRQEPVDSGLLRRMMELIRHRGPDGGGEYLRGPVGLGHRRLSIIDLNTGDQPMCNEDGTVWVVYNGEIYNFPELRADLEKRGHKFKSATDTEVIIHLYEELGEESVERLRGMFAFALWDERQQTLLLARDRVGIKPVYYVNTGKALVFGSEIKSLIADPCVERRINPQGIDRFLTYYYLPGKETLFKGILKLEPGHCLTVKNGQVAVRQYWDLNFAAGPPDMNFPETVAKLRALLRRTVKDHMISDVPVGVLLSGGVDSTGVLRYAAEQTDKPIHTFTIGFAGQGFADERPYARLAAEKYHTLHQEITMTAEDFRDFLPKYIWHMEEPICEPPAVALYFVSKLARESSVKVLLSGEGGDEAFGGYQNYRNLLLLERMKSALGPAKGLLRHGFQALKRVGLSRWNRYACLVEPHLSQYYLSRTSTPYSGFNQLKDALYTEDFKKALVAPPSSHSISPPAHQLVGHFFIKQQNQPALNQMLYVDTKTWLPDDLLVKADKMTMATSVELRVPLLDFQVLEFAASLSPDFKVCGWATKRVLKEALKDSVPKEILERKKTGFPVPYAKWLRTELKDYVKDTLLGPKNTLGSFFHKKVMLDLLSSYQKGAALSAEVFCLLMIELWHQRFAGSATQN
jgi:asparagine synthase (glutamine-hydrolysing)